jgi:hypothetical protein
LFAFAFASVPADMAVAASAEQAIKNWIATVPAADWKIGYRNLAYDRATDRTTVTDLSAVSASMDLSITFTSVAITGYTPTPDGGFNASAMTADGGTMLFDEATITMAGVVVRNFGTAAMTPVPYDKNRPVTSIVQLYANLLKVRVDHAEVAKVTFKDASDGTEFTYADSTLDKWANGKVASMRMGPMEASFVDDDGEPVRFTVGGAETLDTDIDAFLRVYDPARYVAGVGDQIWRPAMRLARYYDIAVESTEFDLAIGDWSLENVKLRQPKESFTAALDRVAMLPKGADPAPADARALFGMFSAFSLGKFSLNDVELDSDAGYGALEAFTIADFSADGIGEISIDALETFWVDGFIAIGRLAAGGIVFPGMDKLIAAYDASLKDQEVDYAELAPRLGYIEAAEVDFETSDTPEVALDKFRLDFGNYVGLVPTLIALEVAGLDAPVDLFSEDNVDVMLKALGYDRLRADYRMKLAWRESDSTIAVDDFHVALTDVGSVTGRAVLGGVSRAQLMDTESLRDAITKLTLVSSNLTVEDKSILNRWIAQQAHEMGVDQTVFRAQLAGSVGAMLQGIGNKAFQDKLAAALKTYIMRPGSVTVSAMPPDPVPAAGIAVLAAIFPETLPQILGLDITAVAGPEPVPFRYVPPTDAGDARHVPLKKY